MNEYELYPGINTEQHRPNIEGYEKSMRIAGFVMWAGLTSLSIAGNHFEQTDAFSSSMLLTAGTCAALLTEYARHERIKPYKAARALRSDT
jgi:hypothetical protein